MTTIKAKAKKKLDGRGGCYHGYVEVWEDARLLWREWLPFHNVTRADALHSAQKWADNLEVS